MTILIVLAVGLLVAFMIVGMYNRLVKLRVTAQNAWADIDVALKRRADLVPNLVETVKGYAGHERSTLEAVTAARTRAVAARDAGPAERAAAEAALTGALHGFTLAMEAYPELQASEGFLDLQTQLSETEDQISDSRRYYNAVVRDLNTAVQTFPSNLLAGPMGFQEREFFEAAEAERATPAVRF
jgi:LemA protein